ncbi:MAG: DUF998 domain-containing protein [Pseudomonadota bacterium]|nr:DUF998 domain-containing protein [Pseudomonadota bacterium]
MQNPLDSLGIARLGTIALAGVTAFALGCVASQFLRPDLNWLRAPMSFYLLGDYGIWLRAAYVALAAALAALGFGYYRALRHSSGNAVPLRLFVIAGTGLCVSTIAESDRSGLSWEGLIHGIAATIAFLCVAIAMLLQSWRMRTDIWWRARFNTAFGLAVVCLVAMLMHVMWREGPRGLSQKFVIGLIVLWLLLAAGWLRSAGEPGSEVRTR